MREREECKGERRRQEPALVCQSAAARTKSAGSALVQVLESPDHSLFPIASRRHERLALEMIARSLDERFIAYRAAR